MRIAYLPDPLKLHPRPGVRRRVEAESAMHFVQVTVQDIWDGVLEKQNFNVICIPGGFAPNYDKSLGSQGKAIIKAFVEKGGGYVGICAGAYLACDGSCKSSSYALLGCRVKDVDWDRGKTNECVIHLHPGGGPVLGPEAEAGGQCVVQYCNGPLLELTGNNVKGTARTLATFVTELRGPKNDYPPAMAGSSAIVAGMYGKGRVVIVSPHLEAGETTRHAHKFRQMYRWASGLVKDPDAVPAPTAAPPAAAKDIPLKIVVGNRHELVSTADDNKHKWTMFVSVTHPDAVEAVIFHLHPTFSPSALKVTTPVAGAVTGTVEYQLARIGWGTFEVGVEILFRGGRRANVQHELSFLAPETAAVVPTE